MKRRNVSIAAGGLICLGTIFASYHHYQSSQQVANSTPKNFTEYLRNLKPSAGESLDSFAKKIEWGGQTYKVLQTQAMRDEFTFQDVRKQVLVPLEQAVLAGKNGDEIAKLFAENATINGLVINPTQLENSRDQIETFNWKTQGESNANLKDYLAQFAKVEDFRIDVGTYHINMTERKEADSSAQAMKLRGFWDLRGSTAKDRQQDVGSLDIEVKKTNDQWQITAIHFGDMKTLRAHRAPAFKDITQAAFTDGSPIQILRREAIRRGGYALALTDANKDGQLDMYVGSGKTSELFLGNEKGQFKKDTKSDFSKEKMVKTAIFADLDNDGDQDLFVTSFDPSEAAEDLVVYENKGAEGYVRIGDPTRGMGRLNSYYPMPAAAGDFNGDGLADIYVGFPGSKDFTFTNLSGHEVVGGTHHVQGLFTNLGGLKFSENELNLGEMKTGNRQYLYPHSALVVDWNKDTKPDIVVIDDQDNLSPFYKNKGKGTFEQVAEKIGVTNSSNAMSFAVGDFNNDGLMDFALSSVKLFAAERYENAMIQMWHRLDEKNGSGMASAGLRLFQQTKNGSFVEVTQAAGVDYVGEGQAGVEFVDYNQDGLQDIFVANGLWSGTDRYQDASPYLVASKIFGDGADDIIKERHNPTQSASDFMQALIGFRGDLFNPDLKGDKTISVGGFQRNRLFRNNGDGTFTDVAFLEGIDSVNDGYVVALGDANHDGRMDFFLRNGDPGQEQNMFPAVQIFENNFPSAQFDRHALSLELRNPSGPVDALNVGVTVEANGAKQYRQVLSNNGAAQSQRILYFGLNNKTQADRVTVHWVEGDQVLTNLKEGYHLIERPQDPKLGDQKSQPTKTRKTSSL